MSDLFSNREIAFGGWFAIFLIWTAWWIATNLSVRQSFISLLRALTNRLILIAIALMLAYVGLMVVLLYWIGLWDTTQIKNTIIWLLSVALMFLFQLNRIAEDPHFFAEAVKDNLRVVAVIEFVVSFYSFSLPIELVIVPLSTLAAMMLALAKSDAKYAKVVTFLTNFLALVGFTLVAYTVYELGNHFGSFATIATAADFAVPILLTILYLPFLFLYAVYMNYQSAFVTLRFALKEPNLIRYAKRRAIVTFNVQTNLLRRWKRQLNSHRLESRSDIEVSLKLVKAEAARERVRTRTPPTS